MKGNNYWAIAKNYGITALLNDQAFSLKVYKGTPLDDATTYTPALRSTDLLLTYSVAKGSLSIDGVDKTKSSMITFPVDATASGSGVATWFAAETTTAVANSYFLGLVSDINGTGILRLTTTSIVSGSIYPLYSFAFKINS